MKKSILFYFYICVTIPLYSQNHLIGIKSGVSWSNIHSREISIDANRTGFTFGLTYDNRIKQNFLIGGEILYQQRGYKIELVYYDNFGNSAPSTKNSILLNSIMIILLFLLKQDILLEINYQVLLILV